MKALNKLINSSPSLTYKVLHTTSKADYCTNWSLFNLHTEVNRTQPAPHLLLPLLNLLGLPSRMLTCTELKGHWRLFVLFLLFYYFFLGTCARLSWILSFRVHVKLFCRIVSNCSFRYASLSSGVSFLLHSSTSSFLLISRSTSSCTHHRIIH